MTDLEMMAELGRLQLQFTDADYHALENKLILYSYVRGWTGDPLQQPVEVVLSMARQVIAERSSR